LVVPVAFVRMPVAVAGRRGVLFDAHRVVSDRKGGLLLLFGRGCGRGFLRRRGVLRLPLGELLGRIDEDVPAHSIVAEAAELRAGELEVAWLGGLEPDG